ncbi:MAG: ribose-5-phosphate isomerase [Bacteroidetes bacterium RBG_19FT_COMBO_42_7]|nr:MAG: ribose-5-phosphate isomerase [Bacteroidetes bacterium RBG_13_42_15]OFY83259.1 MAG: ribose-5-phosphate isomerase [Bacteroidetes bacterium RBG_19FT_COMBO_42_7]
MKNKKIAIVCDHAGYYLKDIIMKFLIQRNVILKDLGCFQYEETDDYADFGHPLAKAVSSREFDFGISICGTGNGMNMTVNKYQGIRSALCWNEEISRLARAHNDANICALPARFINESEACLIVRTFLETEFDGGRHKRRIDKIPLKMY